MWKKVMACAAAAAIAISSVSTAMAAPIAEATVDVSRTGSMTIYKYDMTSAQAEGVRTSYVSTGKVNAEVEDIYRAYAIPGVEFSYLKVGEFQTRTYVDNEAGSAEVKLLYGLDAATVEAFSALEIGTADAVYTENDLSYYMSDTLVDALASALTKNEVAAKNALESFIQKDSSCAKAVTDEAGKIQVNELPLGLYLVVETAVPENVVATVNPFFVSLPMTDLEGDNWMYDVTVYPKNQTGDPTLQKEVEELPLKTIGRGLVDKLFSDTETASGGDELMYQVTSKLPVITSAATYLTCYTFADTLSQGLSYKKSDVTLNWVNHDYELATTWDETSNKFRVSYAAGEAGAEQMTIEITEEGFAEINPNYSEYTLVILYKAGLNSDASVVYGDGGNANEVELTWKRTNMDFADTLKDDCLVYTYGIDLTKRFQSGNGNFAEVTFTLENLVDGYYVAAQQAEDGVYYVTKQATEEEATQFTPASDGSLQIYGLENDVYVLTETATAAGYVLLKDPVQIEIESTIGQHCRVGSAKVNGAAVTMLEENESANAMAPLVIVNEKGFNMPMTGDRGLFLMPLVGLAGSGAMLLLCMAKKRNRMV